MGEYIIHMQIHESSSRAMKSDRKSTYSAPALEKGLDILEFLAGERLSRSQTDIAEALGRSQSEIYRMLACLEERGYVLKDGASGNYRLSLRLFEQAHRQHSTSMLRRAALLPMDALADETEQSCHLSVQHGGNMIVLMERMPSRCVCMSVGEGTTLPLSLTASGKVLLSRMPDEVARETLNNDEYFMTLSQKSRKALLSSLTDIQNLGYYVTKSSQTESVTDIAVSIGIDSTDAAAVIAVPFVSPPGISDKRIAAYLKSVLACAEQINQNLGINR